MRKLPAGTLASALTLGLLTSLLAPPAGARASLPRIGTPVSSFFEDFNGDGYADLAIGSYSETVDNVNRAGSINVVYGSSCGLQGDPTCGNPDDQFFTQNTPGMAGDGAQTAALFGHTQTTADYNGDGYADLAVGSYDYDVGSMVDAGAVNVVYGSATGLQLDGTGGPANQFWTGDSVGMPGDGAQTADQFSHYLASGDFNGDGYWDLAIGLWSDAVGTIKGAGSVIVLYGSPTGLQTGDAGPASQIWTQGSNGVKDQAETNDHFGGSLGSGDFNGDGYTDLVVSVFLESLPGAYQAGAAEIIYGSSCGLDADPTCGNPDDQFLSQGSDGVKDQAEANDWFSRSPASGDFNGDGYADLALGAEKEDVGTVTDAGSVNVIYGSACGLEPDPVCGNPDDQFFTQGSDGMQDQAEPGDFLGRGNRAGDFNGDGFADLAVSAFSEDVGVIVDGGSVNVIYGSTCGLQADPTCGNPDDQFWTQDSPAVHDMVETSDQFGKNLGQPADFNGDGYADLPVGVHQEDIAGITNCGMAQIFYGSGAYGIQSKSPDDQEIVQGHNGVQDQAEKWDRFGWFG